MRGRLTLYSILIVLLAGVSSCNSYSKLLKSPDMEKKYTAALDYYHKKDYYKAGQLFDELLIAFKGDKRFEEIYFYYAYCKYGNNEMVMASYHFNNFYESFPNSERAEEALYMHVYCDYIETYPYYLDPSVTRMAMDNIQLFINVYPTSTRVPNCNGYMDELRGRLRKKSLESAKLYYKMEDYQAAILAFNNTIKDYPELENKAEVEATMVKCQFMLASHSSDAKKVQRFKDVKPMAEDFQRRYGKDNVHYPQVMEYYNKSIKALNDLALEAGYRYYEQGEYVLAAEAFRDQCTQPHIANKNQLMFLVVKANFKAGKAKNNALYFEKAIKEADAFLAEFGEENTYSNKVKKFRNKAQKALK
ncbi:MAG: outer membrane protein assembly factor BamD [Bacteroidia bacterium]